MIEKDVAPEGYMTDSQGRLVPIGMIKPIDLLRDQTVRALIQRAKDLNEQMVNFKADAFDDIDTFIETSAEQYKVKVGGKKGGISLYSFDGRYQITRSFQELIRFDEQLQAAKALIDECLTDWTAESKDEVKVIVNDAFRVNQQGHVRTQEVLRLRRLNIKDPRWVSAMEAITNAITVVGTKPYVRLYERVGQDGATYRQIPLDIATL
jgi:hypothetical protein